MAMPASPELNKNSVLAAETWATENSVSTACFQENRHGVENQTGADHQAIGSGGRTAQPKNGFVAVCDMKTS